MNQTIKYINSSTTIENIRNQCYEMIDSCIENENTACEKRLSRLDGVIQTYIMLVVFMLINIVINAFIFKAHWISVVLSVLILLYDVYILISRIYERKQGKAFTYLTTSIMNTIKQEVKASDDETAMLEIRSMLHSNEIDGMALLWRDDIESILYNGKILHISYKNGCTAALLPTIVRGSEIDCITILKSGIFVGSQTGVKSDVTTKKVNIVYYEDIDSRLLQNEIEV